MSGKKQTGRWRVVLHSGYGKTEILECRNKDEAEEIGDVLYDAASEETGRYTGMIDVHHDGKRTQLIVDWVSKVVIEPCPDQ